MKNKIISILCVFLLISCLFINGQVFATDTTITYSLPTDYNGTSPYFMYKLSNGYYYCWIFYDVSTTDGIYLKTTTDNVVGAYSLNNDSLLSCAVDIYEGVNGISWSKQGTDATGSHYRFDGVPTVLSCSNNFYKHNGDVLFQLPVQETITPELAEIMKTAGEQATMEVGQIILMVMKVTAGLIACVIGFKAGWKFFRDGWWT